MYDYGFRVYDARIGKFLSVDPLTQKYPWYTPYQFAGNMPIRAIDLDGLEEHIVIKEYSFPKVNPKITTLTSKEVGNLGYGTLTINSYENEVISTEFETSCMDDIRNYGAKLTGIQIYGMSDGAESLARKIKGKPWFTLDFRELSEEYFDLFNATFLDKFKKPSSPSESKTNTAIGKGIKAGLKQDKAKDTNQQNESKNETSERAPIKLDTLGQNGQWYDSQGVDLQGNVTIKDGDKTLEYKQVDK